MPCAGSQAVVIATGDLQIVLSPAVGTEVEFAYVCVLGGCVWPYVAIDIAMDREAFHFSGRLWSPTLDEMQRDCSPEVC